MVVDLEVVAPLKKYFVSNHRMSRMLCILVFQRQTNGTNHATATEGNFHPSVDNGLNWHQRE